MYKLLIIWDSVFLCFLIKKLICICFIFSISNKPSKPQFNFIKNSVGISLEHNRWYQSSSFYMAKEHIRKKTSIRSLNSGRKFFFYMRRTIAILCLIFCLQYSTKASTATNNPIKDSIARASNQSLIANAPEKSAA